MMKPRPQNYRQNNYDYEEKLNSEINKYFSPSEDLSQEEGGLASLKFRGGVMT